MTPMIKVEMMPDMTTTTETCTDEHFGAGILLRHALRHTWSELDDVEMLPGF